MTDDESRNFPVDSLAKTANYWLLKSEPDEFSIDMLKERGTEEWSGVRNYLARNHLRAMALGDEFLFYHSSCAAPGVVGVGKIARIAAADPSQFEAAGDYFDAKSTPENPRWSSVLTRYVRHMVHPVGLDRLRLAAADLPNFALLNRGNRLSVLPVSTAEWRVIVALGAKK
jgi:predicted RNA-binding protein with PUA-like domain